MIDQVKTQAGRCLDIYKPPNWPDNPTPEIRERRKIYNFGEQICVGSMAVAVIFVGVAVFSENSNTRMGLVALAVASIVIGTCICAGHTVLACRGERSEEGNASLIESADSQESSW